MPNEKLITLLTPLYNRAKFLRTYVEGLANQSYLDKMKIVVCDDGSTDESPKVLKKYCEEFNLEVELLYNKKNLGLLQTTFKLYHKIDTKYWTVLDPDDYYISPDKIKKAVEFLEAHEDYSCYACTNLSEWSDGRKVPIFPPDRPSQTYSGMKNSPFFQTASTTFRNYFSPKSMKILDGIIKGLRDHPFSADAFRNFWAHHFGKFYFENSVDSVWRRDVGDWGTSAILKQDISNMTAHLDFFKYNKEWWGVDEQAMHCLNLSLYFYNKVLNEFVKHMRHLDIFDFERALYNDNKVGQHIFKELIAQVKELNTIGVKINVQ